MKYSTQANKNYVNNFDYSFGRKNRVNESMKEFLSIYGGYLPAFIKIDSKLQEAKIEEKPFADIGLSNCIEKVDDKSSVVFSSDGPEGFYDIATMSDRGIKSCQAWDENKRYSTGTIGTLLDPYVGIIYTTDNTSVPGHPKERTLMLKRALVRYVLSHKENNIYSASIFMERIYSNNDGPKILNGCYNNKDNEESKTRKTFLDFLKRKTSNMNVVYSHDLSHIDRALYFRINHKNMYYSNGQQIYTCVDSGILYSRYSPSTDRIVNSVRKN